MKRNAQGSICVLWAGILLISWRGHDELVDNSISIEGHQAARYTSTSKAKSSHAAYEVPKAFEWRNSRGVTCTVPYYVISSPRLDIPLLECGWLT
jgi:hypothetical protein